MAVTIEFDVLRNEFPSLLAQFDGIVNRAIRKQILVTEADLKTNIVRYDAIDTGNMLNSTRGEMVSAAEGLVSVSAESEDGYPYPWIVNYGGVHVAPRPYWSDAEAKAEDEYPGRMRREFEASFP